MSKGTLAAAHHDLYPPLADSRRDFIIKTAILLAAFRLQHSFAFAAPPLQLSASERELLQRHVEIQLAGQTWDKSLRAAAAISAAAQNKKKPDLNFAGLSAAGTLARTFGPKATSDILALSNLPSYARELGVSTGLARTTVSQFVNGSALTAGSIVENRLRNLKDVNEWMECAGTKLSTDQLLSRATTEVQTVIKSFQAGGKLKEIANNSSLSVAELTVVGDLIGGDIKKSTDLLKSGMQAVDAKKRLAQSIDTRNFEASAKEAVFIAQVAMQALNIGGAQAESFNKAASMVLTAVALYAALPMSAMSAVSFVGSASSLFGGGDGGSAEGAAMAQIQKTLQEIIGRLQRIEANQEKILTALRDLNAEVISSREVLRREIVLSSARINAKIEQIIENKRLDKLITLFETNVPNALNQMNAGQGMSDEALVNIFSGLQLLGTGDARTIFSFGGDVFKDDAEEILLRYNNAEMTLNMFAGCDWFSAVGTLNLPGMPIPPVIRKDSNPVIWEKCTDALLQLTTARAAFGKLPIALQTAVSRLREAGLATKKAYNDLSRAETAKALQNASLNEFWGSDNTSGHAGKFVRGVIVGAWDANKTNEIAWNEEILSAPKPNGEYSFRLWRGPKHDDVEKWSYVSGNIFARAVTAIPEFANKPLLAIEKHNGFLIQCSGWRPVQGDRVSISPVFADGFQLTQTIWDRLVTIPKGQFYIGKTDKDKFQVVSALPGDQNVAPPLDVSGLITYLRVGFMAIQLKTFVDGLNYSYSEKLLKISGDELASFRSFISSAMYANLSLAIAIWRSGAYPYVATPLGEYGGGMRRIDGVPPVYGHHGDCLFGPHEIFARLISRLRGIAVAPVLPPQSRHQVAYFEKLADGTERNWGETHPTAIAHQMVREIMSGTAITDHFPPATEASIPPIEIGLARLAAIEAMLKGS